MALLGVWPVFLWEPTGETGDPVLQRLVDPGTVGPQLVHLLHVAWWRGGLCWREAAPRKQVALVVELGHPSGRQWGGE